MSGIFPPLQPPEVEPIMNVTVNQGGHTHYGFFSTLPPNAAGAVPVTK